MEFANEFMIDVGIERVIIRQLIRREKCRHFSAEERASHIASVNDLLLAACQGCDVIISM